MKSKLTLSVDGDLVRTAKERGINISSFLENKLAEEFKLKKVTRWVQTEGKN